jgi:hypothetical protein
MIEPGHPRQSIARQCELVSISRSGFYYQPTGETPLNLELMRLIDAQFLETPWYGSPPRTCCHLAGTDSFPSDTYTTAVDVAKPRAASAACICLSSLPHA